MTGPEEEEETETETETEDGEDKVYAAGDGDVLVTVTAPAGALPSDAELQVVLYGENSEQYEEAAEIIGVDSETVSSVEADESGVATLAGYGADLSAAESRDLAVVDIRFVANGVEVEPAEPVNVVIDASALIPEDVDASTIEIQHLVEGEDGEVTPIVVASETEVAEFEVESFSSFTITWTPETGSSTSTTVTVYVYDMNGLGIYDAESSYELTADSITISDLVSEHASSGISGNYTFLSSAPPFNNGTERIA